MQICITNALQTKSIMMKQNCWCIYCFVTNHPKAQWLKTITILLFYFTIFCIRNLSRVWLADSFALCGVDWGHLMVLSRTSLETPRQLYSHALPLVGGWLRRWAQLASSYSLCYLRPSPCVASSKVARLLHCSWGLQGLKVWLLVFLNAGSGVGTASLLPYCIGQVVTHHCRFKVAETDSTSLSRSVKEFMVFFHLSLKVMVLNRTL